MRYRYLSLLWDAIALAGTGVCLSGLWQVRPALAVAAGGAALVAVATLGARRCS